MGESSRSEGSAAHSVELIAPGDGQALARFFARNRAAPGSELFDPFELTATRAGQIASGRSLDRFYAAHADGEIVALSMLRGFAEGFEVPSLGLLVDREHRRRGFGRRMTEAAIAAARELGCPAIRLSVYASNEAAMALYRSLGFAEHERTGVARRDGERDTKLIMVLALGDDGA